MKRHFQLFEISKLAIRVACLAALTLVYPAVTSASLISVVNASFEADTMFTNTSVLGDWSPGTLNGWSTNASDSGVYRPNAAVLVPTDGLNTAYSNGGTISQVLTATTVANTNYTLSVDVGDRTDTSPLFYTVELWANSSLVAAAFSAVPNDGWVTATANWFSASSSGESLEIRLVSSGSQVNFDNVRLTAVPEPSAVLLTMVPFALMSLRRRR